MSIRSVLTIRTGLCGTSGKNLRTLNQDLHLRRPNPSKSIDFDDILLKFQSNVTL